MGEEAKRDPLGIAICQALGLEPDVTSRLTLVIVAGRPPKLLTEQYISGEKPSDGLLTTLKEYKLVPIEEGDDHA